MLDIESEKPPLPVFAPDRIHIVENYLGTDACMVLCKHIEDEWAKKPADNSAHIRSAYVAPLGSVKETVHAICYQVMTHIIEPFFEVDIEWWESPQLLRYAKGGKYHPHSDSENWKKEGNGYWKREHDRDISLLIYLNEGFKGGQLHFPIQDIRITPKPGLLVAFPSTHEFKHGAEPTEEGLRYVMVTWAAARGFPRVRSERPNHSVLLKDYQVKNDARI